MKKAVSMILILVLLSVLPTFSACSEKPLEVRVMVEEGEYYEVLGKNPQSVEIGGDVSFGVEMSEGCYYVSNNAGAEFSDGTLTLKNVRTPQTVVIDADITYHTVRLNAAEGMTVYSDGEPVSGLSVEAPYGGDVVFDVSIDENYEYAGTTLIGGGSVDYDGGRLTVKNVRADSELFVQLRKKAEAGKTEVTVRLIRGEGFSVRGAYEKTVTVGSDVVFEITVTDGYYYVTNNCGAVYLDGTVTLNNVKADQDIVLFFGRENVSTEYYAHGSVRKATVSGGIVYSAFADPGYVFTYWTDGGERYSYANNVVLPEETELKPVFESVSAGRIVTYHANGGRVKGSADDSVTYVFSSDVYLYPAAFGEWCFKTFEREGYVPIEYNTAADGSGRAYSLGSRIFESANTVDIYVMWAEESPADDFTFGYVTENGKNVGVELTKYTGRDETVVVPLTVEGLPVITVSGGCFEGSGIKKVVITRNVKTVERRAFASCEKLKTVYLCDSVEYIYDDSFSDCPELSDLRMTAVLPPVYSNHLIGTTVRRFELLYDTRNDGKTNIVFYGGSSIFQGIDGATVAGMFNESFFRIINGGQNAYVSGALMLDLYSCFMRRGDVMVFVPEYGKQVYSNEWDMPTWIALEEFYDAFRFIDLRDYTGVFGAFREFQHGSSSYTYVGKLRQLEDGKALSYEDYNDTVNEYFTRADNFDVVKADVTQDLTPIDYDMFKNYVTNVTNKIYLNKYVPRSITMYFASCGMWEYAFTGDKSQYTMYETWLKNYLEFSYISNCLDHLFPIEYISDSISHLTREGAVIHSRILGRELISQMHYDGYL